MQRSIQVRAEGALTRRHSARRSVSRTLGTGERVTGRRAPLRASNRVVRHVPRRLRPEVVIGADFLPAVVH
jgi:hypothetical protein